MKNVHSVTVWGDSVMKGVVFDEQKGKYALLPECGAERASKALGLELHNRSRMGCTVTKGLLLVKKDLQLPVDSQAAIIEFGGNDCDHNWEEISQRPTDAHHPKTPLAIFESQLTDMIVTVKQKGITPIMMSLPPIHAERYFDFFTRNGLNKENILRWLGDVQFIYRWHERYNAAVVRVAQQCGCLLADIREVFLGQRHYEDWLCIDGIHPNEKGHEAMENVLENFGISLKKQGVLAV